MSSREEFGVLLYELSQRLNEEEVAAIILIEDLPQKYYGKKSLEVLIQLQMSGKISESDPATLQSVLKNINRMDLANKVKDFIKSHKKKKNHKAGLADRLDKMAYDLEANLTIAHIQTQVLRDQLINVATAANKCGDAKMVRMFHESIRALRNEVEHTINCARSGLDNRSSPESSGDDDSPKSTLTRQQHPASWQESPQNPELARQITERLQGLHASVQYPIQEESHQDDEDEGLYEVISNVPRIPSTSTPLPVSDEHYYATADMVPTTEPVASTHTGIRPDEAQRRVKATVPNTASGEGSRPKTKAKPKTLPKPSIKATQSKHSDECSVESGIDDCSYTGGTGSGSDSGFSESWRYMKRPIALPRHSSLNRSQTGAQKPRPTASPRPPPKPSSYTSLNTEQVKLSYYKSSARETNQIFQDLMSGTLNKEEEEKEEHLYQNIRRS